MRGKKVKRRSATRVLIPRVQTFTLITPVYRALHMRCSRLSKYRIPRARAANVYLCIKQALFIRDSATPTPPLHSPFLALARTRAAAAMNMHCLAWQWRGVECRPVAITASSITRSRPAASVARSLFRTFARSLALSLPLKAAILQSAHVIPHRSLPDCVVVLLLWLHLPHRKLPLCLSSSLSCAQLTLICVIFFVPLRARALYIFTVQYFFSLGFFFRSRAMWCLCRAFYHTPRERYLAMAFDNSAARASLRLDCSAGSIVCVLLEIVWPDRRGCAPRSVFCDDFFFFHCELRLFICARLCSFYSAGRVNNNARFVVFSKRFFWNIVFIYNDPDGVINDPCAVDLVVLTEAVQRVGLILAYLSLF